MPLCQALMAGEDGQLRRCAVKLQCRSLGLDIIFSGLKNMDVKQCDDEALVSTNATLVRAYIERLERAVRLREEHHKIFLVQEAMSAVDDAHRLYPESLRDSHLVARAFLGRLGKEQDEFSAAKKERECNATLAVGGQACPVDVPSETGKCVCCVHEKEHEALCDKLKRTLAATGVSSEGIEFTKTQRKMVQKVFDHAVVLKQTTGPRLVYDLFLVKYP
ncbi:hypothetical protein C8Q80DRAFT_1116949 [Daedaleopsis nitida]|nr:hypothetical protein C8Q80DRAFT_1116949 [Daedaleopsis nitida]